MGVTFFAILNDFPLFIVHRNYDGQRLKDATEAIPELNKPFTS